ncbi:MAG: arylsulfatase [Balneolaceae bacterium]
MSNISRLSAYYFRWLMDCISVLMEIIIAEAVKGNRILLIVLGFMFLNIHVGCTDVQNDEEPDKPNVIYINADDLGYGDLSAYGGTKIKTPNIDRLAKEGRRFTDAHSASAVCSPSRYALITGEYPARKEFWYPIFSRDTLQVDQDKLTIADVMKEAGYSTSIIGKWHLGFGNDYPVNWNEELKPGPLELGFDYYYGIPVLNSHPPFVYVENHNVLGLDENDPLVYGEEAKTREFDEKFDIDEFGGGEAAHELYKDREVGTTLKNKAINWIKDNKENPFFLYFTPPQIHHPFTPDPQFIGTSKAGMYGDFIHELDWMIGEILNVLDEEGLAENTLLIFTSDNGAMLNRGGQTAWEAGHKMNSDLLGFKFGAWEGGHRVPFIARWPGQIPAGSESDELLSNVDILATLAALVDHSLQEGDAPDSYNMLPAITGTPEESIRDYLVISPSQRSHLSIRKGKWMYIPARGEGGFGGTEIGDHDFAGAAAHKLTGQTNSDIRDGVVRENAPDVQLYDLESDPAQKENIVNDYPEVAEELQKLLEETI